MYLPESLDNFVKSIIRSAGYVLYRTSSPHSHLDRRSKILRSHDIRLILDVGANTGQYAIAMRNLGYCNRIVSFEPMTKPFMELEKRALSDTQWECNNFALGDRSGELSINISQNSISSSILPMMREHLDNSPGSKFISSQSIRVKRLDELTEWTDWSAAGPVWLKIDVQGFEDHVLDGAGSKLAQISVIQLELSLRPLYEGQLTILPMMQKLRELGFDPIAFEPGFTDRKTGESLQVDGIFRNRQLARAV